MRPSTAVLSLVTLAAGAGGGWAAYELAGEPTETTATTAVADESPTTGARGTRVRWAPCEPPAVLRGNTCVTSVVRTVVLPAPAAAPRVPATGSAPATPAYQGDGDEGYDDADDHEEDEADDHDDEDHDEDD